MSGSVVLMLPGLLCDAEVWRPQCEALGVDDCIVASYGMADSIEAMARAALACVPVERFALAGHSMGGRVALEIARQVPARVERIALLDTGAAPLETGPAAAHEVQARMAWLALARRRGMRTMGRGWARGMVHPQYVDGPLFDTILDMIARKTPDEFEAQIRALIGRPDAREVLRRLHCPTLLLCGRDDAWSPLSRHEQMHRSCPVSSLAVIDDCGHMSTLEQPAAVTQALRNWLEQP